MTIATGHRNLISLEMHIVIAKYSLLMSWRYRYSLSLLMVSSSPLLLVIHRRGEYPLGFDDVLIGFECQQILRFQNINIAAFRLLLSVLVSDKRLRLRASLVIDDVCLYRFAGTSLIVGL